MERRTENKIVVVVRRSRLDDLISRFNTVDQAKFYVEHSGADFSDYLLEDRNYKQVIKKAEDILSRHGRVQVIERSFLPNFIFGENDTVVAIGQDGLVANVLKYLNGQQLIGLNPDIERWEGILLPFSIDDLEFIISQVFSKKRIVTEVTFAEARLNNGEKLLAVNDFFIGPKTHTSARYAIKIGDKSEQQSSSGIIVSTGLGSTGWLRSILAGATGISSALSGRSLKLAGKKAVAWDSEYLYFSVREPWPSMTTGANITFGKITTDQPLVITSHMPENGIIFSDGIESDYMSFNSGTEVVISIARKKGYLVK